MKKSIKILSLVACLLLTISMFAGCGNKPATDDAGVSIKMSVIYDGTKTRVKFDQTIAPYASIVDGTKYAKGNLKPTWKELQKRLNFSVSDVATQTATSVTGAFQSAQSSGFNNVNIISGPVSGINEEGVKNQTFVDLKQYKTQLKDFFEFIEKPENDIVEKCVTAENGAIYYTPYFDGYDDIETMFLCRVDWVEKLLDGDATYDTARTLAANKDNLSGTNTTYYNGFYESMDTSFTAMKNATETQSVSVKYTSGNGIIALQNALTTKNGAELVRVLKEYIQEKYVTPGYISKPSELFCGQSACYNADELVALWRCVYTNPKLLCGDETKIMVPFYPRSSGADRANEVLQLVQLWGVRGYESRNNYFYFDAQGVLQDARVSDDMLQALVFLNQLYNEGLILNDYMQKNRTQDHRDYYNNQNLGFMTYDYNQTTSIYNVIINDSQTADRNISPILFPVADWDNKATSAGSNKYAVSGTNTLYQYTESWRSVKTEGWALTASTVNDTEKLNKCLEIMNYMYTDEGQRLMTFGPDEWIEHDASGNIVTIDYKGRQVPKISTNALKELNDPTKGKSNYTNYYRQYVGATLPLGFVKDQGMEYQTVDEKGKIGLDYINNAAIKGVLKHATVGENTENKQNRLVPTTFALSQTQTNTINNEASSLLKNFNNSSADGQNIFHNYVMFGYGDATNGTKTMSALKAEITSWGLNTYIDYHRSAYNKMYTNN